MLRLAVIECGINMPQNEPGIVSHGEHHPSCLLPQGHKGDHFSATSHGFFVWSFDDEYCVPLKNCACYSEEGLIECFQYHRMEKDEGPQLLAYLRRLPCLVQRLFELSGNDERWEMQKNKQLAFSFY